MAGGARLGDKAQVPLDAHGCPACPHPGVGPAIAGSPDVNTNRRPAIRLDDPGIHGYKAIDAMLHAVDARFDDIGGDQSIMSMLQELGIDTGDLNNAHESVRKALEPRLDGFKRAEQSSSGIRRRSRQWKA